MVLSPQYKRFPKTSLKAVDAACTFFRGWQLKYRTTTKAPYSTMFKALADAVFANKILRFSAQTIAVIHLSTTVKFLHV